MSMQLNKWGFQKLINENIEWLERQPRTLERDHIIDMMRSAPDMYYGKRDEEGRITEIWDPRKHEIGFAKAEAPIPSHPLPVEAGDLREAVARHLNITEGLVLTNWDKWDNLTEKQRALYRVRADKILNIIPAPPHAGGRDLAWTREKPTAEGWYWMRYVNGAGCVVDVGRYNDGFAIDRGWGYDPIVENTEWAGPIPEPRSDAGGAGRNQDGAAEPEKVKCDFCHGHGGLPSGTGGCPICAGVGWVWDGSGKALPGAGAPSEGK